MSFSNIEHEESFNNLPMYLHNLRRTNPHSHPNGFDGSFPILFSGYWMGGSVRLRGDYLKTMFVAVAKDVNNLTFPIAFGMAFENNLVSCNWFLMRLKEILRQGREVAFISNMEDVVSYCIDDVFTKSYHVYTSYTMSIFEKKFPRLSRDAHEVLTNIGHLKWARAYFPIIRWNVLDMEVPQFFSVLLLNPCNVPIITLIEGIREYMRHTFVERSLMSGSLTTVLTPYVEMVLQRRMQKSFGWQATQIHQEISSPFPTYIYLVSEFKTVTPPNQAAETSEGLHDLN
uniref:MULE transposase domain-containing protein n=1 Tax=Lactuca sativa TaxID=4236 RepID=A0A9R1X2R1_LACSA|nr:hypothetical protein LSAT_V11C700368440 [Lactuca sativa]